MATGYGQTHTNRLLSFCLLLNPSKSNHMKGILIWLGFIRPASFENQKLEVSFKSYYPKNQPSYHQWCKEFRVSMLHGKQTVHM